MSAKQNAVTNTRWSGLCVVLAMVLMTAGTQTYSGEEAPAAKKPTLNAGDYFQEPKALVDQDGKIILTKRGTGHPMPYDYNGDGKPDILLGAKLNLNTARAELLMLENVGTAKEPRFQWPPNHTMRPADGDSSISANCGCKSGGTFEIHPSDYNGDGFFDLLINTRSSSKEGAFLMLNTKASKTKPFFKKDRKVYHLKSHGRGSGGGDWTGDGAPDFVLHVNRYGWTLFPGKKDEKGAYTFAAKATLSSRAYKMLGHDAYPKTKRGTAWFDYTPYAWNWTGKHTSTADSTDVIAVMGSPTVKNACDINLYTLSHKEKTCTFRGTLTTNPARFTRVAMGDLNSDGCMDVIYTGGMFSKGNETQIWVLYGKVKNVGTGVYSVLAAKQ